VPTAPDPGPPIDDAGNPPVSARVTETEGPLPPGSTSQATDHPRQTRTTCPVCDVRRHEGELLRVGVGILACVRDGRCGDARTLAAPLCRPHHHGAVAVALVTTRHADVITAELRERHQLDSEDEDELRDDLLAQLALDLALPSDGPYSERTRP
jgi:hypothetical protein